MCMCVVLYVYICSIICIIFFFMHLLVNYHLSREVIWVLLTFSTFNEIQHTKQISIFDYVTVQ